MTNGLVLTLTLTVPFAILTAIRLYVHVQGFKILTLSELYLIHIRLFFSFDCCSNVSETIANMVNHSTSFLLVDLPSAENDRKYIKKILIYYYKLKRQGMYASENAWTRLSKYVNSASRHIC